MNTPQRRALPNLFVDVDDYRYLDRKARERGISLGELIKEALNPLLEQEEAGSGHQVVLHIPERTHQQFMTFFDGDEDVTRHSMIGCLEVNGNEFAESMKSAETR